MKEGGKYHIARDGGRVKSAGTSVDFVLKLGDEFAGYPAPDTAAEAARTFHVLRDNPPTAIRNRFFPHSRGEIKALMRNSPALFRPVLKTDQGAGKFLPFTVGGGDGIMPKVEVERELGYVIPEAHFADQIREKQPTQVIDELRQVKEQFRDGNLYETNLAFERLQLESEASGLVFKRRADVGRNALMFIHPAEAKSPIVVPESVAQRAEAQVQAAIERLDNMAYDKQRDFAEAHNLPRRKPDNYSKPFYLQADMHIFPNGESKVAELQVPDVGMFLAGLPKDGNEPFGQVQEVVKSLKEKVLDGFEKTVRTAQAEKSDIPVYLVTRKEVVEDKEDVLEIRELEQVQAGLKDRGIATRVLTAEQAAQLDQDSLSFLFNLDPHSEEFEQLAATYLKDSKGKLRMSPSPFYRSAEREITDYKKTFLNRAEVDNFHALVGEVELFDKKNKVFSQMMAIDYFLRKAGISGDVLHFFDQKLATPIPAYRYDIRGLHVASNMMKSLGLDTIQVRSIPISQEQGVVQDMDRGTLYATFRFMVLREDV